MTRLLLLVLVFAGAAQAQTLEDTRAFDRAYAASFYIFDGCGDAKYGLLFRDALDARFAQCPFSDQAREAHKRRNVLQSKKSRDLMKKLIDETGGVPVRLPGMSETCRQRQNASDYVEARARLERFSQGTLRAEDIVSGPCDSETLTP